MYLRNKKTVCKGVVIEAEVSPFHKNIQSFLVVYNCKLVSCLIIQAWVRKVPYTYFVDKQTGGLELPPEKSGFGFCHLLPV